MVPQWQVPDAVSDKFFFSFYQALKTNDNVSEAIGIAVDNVKKDDRYGFSLFLSLHSPLICGVNYVCGRFSTPFHHIFFIT